MSVDQNVSIFLKNKQNFQNFVEINKLIDFLQDRHNKFLKQIAKNIENF